MRSAGWIRSSGLCSMTIMVLCSSRFRRPRTSKVCWRCEALDDQMVPLGQPFYEDTFGDGLPPRHPNCRCAVAPVTLEQVKQLPEDHPLRNNYRESIAALTDRETYTEIGRYVITGQARRHWTLRHERHMNVALAERELPEILSRGQLTTRIKTDRKTGQIRELFQVIYPAGKKTMYIVSVHPIRDEGNPKMMVGTFYLRPKKETVTWKPIS